MKWATDLNRRYIDDNLTHLGYSTSLIIREMQIETA